MMSNDLLTCLASPQVKIKYLNCELTCRVGSEVSWSISFIDDHWKTPTVASSGSSNMSENVSIALDLAGNVSMAMRFP